MRLVIRCFSHILMIRQLKERKINVKLSKIADISVGIILSRKQDRLRENNIYSYNSITLKSLQNSGCINEENLEKVYLKDIVEEELLTKKEAYVSFELISKIFLFLKDLANLLIAFKKYFSFQILSL